MVRIVCDFCNSIVYEGKIFDKEKSKKDDMWREVKIVDNDAICCKSCLDKLNKIMDTKEVINIIMGFYDLR